MFQNKIVSIITTNKQKNYNSDKYIISFYSYRIERAMTINNLQNEFENEMVIYKGIIYAVDVHRKAMELVFSC